MKSSKFGLSKVIGSVDTAPGSLMLPVALPSSCRLSAWEPISTMCCVSRIRDNDASRPRLSLGRAATITSLCAHYRHGVGRAIRVRRCGVGLPAVRRGVPPIGPRCVLPRGHRDVAVRPDPEHHQRGLHLQRQLPPRRDGKTRAGRSLDVSQRARCELSRPYRSGSERDLRHGRLLPECVGLRLAAARIPLDPPQGVPRFRPDVHAGGARGRRPGRVRPDPRARPSLYVRRKHRCP